MNESEAREVVLVLAFETVHPTPTSWTEDDRAWATRVALEDAGPAAVKRADAFIVRRAHHAMQRLAPREPAATAWLQRRLWRWRWVGWGALVGVVVGLMADSIGSGQRINLLAPPLWGVLLWNVFVYVVLLAHVLARLLMRPTRPGVIVRLTGRVLRLGRGLSFASTPGVTANGNAKALQTFTSQWLRFSAPLASARAATVLHVAAAALALGLIGGMYARGLVLDYRAAWESTFLDAGTAHAVLSFLLAPAAALSHIAVPDAASFEAMRGVHGVVPDGAPAAPWIHLLALTLALVIVLPRSVLAVLGAMRARWLSGHVALPLQDAYFQRLTRAQRAETAQVFVAPYANAPDARLVPALLNLLAPSLGDILHVEVGPLTAFGAEDDAAHVPVPRAGTTLAIALFDLAATPEVENQGRFAQQLAAHAPTLMLVDEFAFAQRFKAEPARIAQRRDAWRVLALALGTTPVFINTAAKTGADAGAVGPALRSPVSAASAP